MRILEEHPDYHVFENNCQNFVKYLLEAVCPSAPIPATIQMVLERFQDMSLTPEKVSLPGAYPLSIHPSIISTDRQSFVTASETSWVTASETSWVTAAGDTWVTAVECGSIRDSLSLFSEASVMSKHLSFKGSRFQFDDESTTTPLMDPILEEPPQEIKSSPLASSTTPKAREVREYKIVVVGGGMVP